MSDPATPHGSQATPGEHGVHGDIADVEVRRSKGPSIVWLVPIVAVAIAAWLWIQAEREKGPEITIMFTTADDIEAGKTLIKFKNVNIGKVDTIRFSQDLSHVVLTAAMDRKSAPFLRQSARFWVVRPRIGSRGISGLGTLVSGAYIAMEPATEGPLQSDFEGLDNPPVAPNDAPGLKLQLTASTLGSIDVGSGVYFRDIQAGAVESYRLAPDSSSLQIDVYIEPEFAPLVKSNSHFWNVSGIHVSMSTTGVEVGIQSVDTLIRGGIAFEVPPDETPGEPTHTGQVFKLFDDKTAAFEKLRDSLSYVVYFTGSVRGLSTGAPVEFRGIEVGRVKDFWLEYDTGKTELHIPVLIEMYTGTARRIGADPGMSLKEGFESLIQRGLRAQLATANFVTGALFVSMDLFPGTPITLMGHGEYPEVPSVPSTGETVENSLAQLTDIVDNLQSLVEHANQRTPELLQSAQETSLAARAALDQAVTTLKRMDQLVAQSSELQEPLQDVLREMSVTLRSIRSLADMLDRHPEALIQGKHPGDQ